MKACRLGILLLLLPLLLGSCGTAGKAAAVLPTMMRIRRTIAFRQNGVAPFQRTVRNATAVQALYRATLSLPSSPRRPISCPASFGIRYRLNFLRGGTRVLLAVAEASGCQFVTVGHSARRATPKFWALLARALGWKTYRQFPFRHRNLPPGGSPAPPSPAATPSVLNPTGIAFWSPLRGVLVGQDCRRSNCSGTIAITSDGGRNWQTRYRSKGFVFTSATVTGRVYGWAIASVSGCQGITTANCPRQLLYTQDGGRTWQVIGRPRIGDPSFASPRLGWAPAPARLPSATLQPAGIRTTTDGGQTWQTRSGPGQCQGQGWRLQSLSFPSVNQGYALCSGEGSAGAQDKAIYASTDGGRTWHQQALAAFGFSPGRGIPLTGYPSGIFFLPDGHGWLWQRRGNLLTTTDGGANWQTSFLTQPGNSLVARSVWFLSESTGFVLLSGYAPTTFQPTYQLVVTQNGGQTWTALRQWP